MVFHLTRPANFTRLGGVFLDHPADINIVPVGTVTVPLHGDYYSTNTPSGVHHWELLYLEQDPVTKRWETQTVTGGAITAATGAFTIPSGLRTQPRWMRLYLYDATGACMGGGMLVQEPAGTPWPTGDEQYVLPRLGLPGRRYQIADAANPSAAPGDPSFYYWGTLDFVAAETTDVWDDVDPVRGANVDVLVNYPGYNGTTAELAGVTSTALRYAGKGWVYEGPNEYHGVPNAGDAGFFAAFARAVWAGESAARVAMACPVSFNHAKAATFSGFLTALKATLTTPEWAKIVVSVHDYNLGSDRLQAVDDCWGLLTGILTTVGLSGRALFITEHDGFEAAHYGAGDLVRQLARFSTTNLVAQTHTVRERLFLFYLRDHGQNDYSMWHMSESGSPYPVVAWEATLERETRRALFELRHDPGSGVDGRTVLSLQFSRADGTRTVVAKACARPTAPVTYQLTATSGATVPSTVTAVDWQGQTYALTVDGAGRFTDTLTPLPSHYRLPANVSAALVPATRTPYTELAFISSQSGYGVAPSPVNATIPREAQSYDQDFANDTRFAWRTLNPFSDGDWVGVHAGSPFTLRSVEIATPIPKNFVSTIVSGDLQIRTPSGAWVAATLDGDPVVIDEATPYKIVATTAQDGVKGWYEAFDIGAHHWHLDVDPVTCTGWRVVVHQVTAGESPTVATLKSSPGPYVNVPDDYAGFGTDAPYLYVAGLWTNGTAGSGSVPGGPVRYLVRAS